MLESDIKIVAPIPGWRAEDQIRINSGIIVERQTHWAEAAETFARHTHTGLQPLGNVPATSRVAVPRPRFSSPDFMAIRALSGIYPPKDDWRRLSADEMAKVYGITDETDLASTVQVMEIPHWLIEAARETAKPHLASGKYEFAEGVMDISAVHFPELIERMDAWLAETVFTHSGWLMVSMRATVPMRKTSSGSEGLHIDLYGPPLGTQMSNGYNGSRFIVNLTDETRHIAFINLKLSTMMAKCPGMLDRPKAHGVDKQVLMESRALRMASASFMEACPDYPVIRLAIEPGQGYLAPTPAIAHEGLLTDQQHGDLILLASHKGYDGTSWIAPRYSAEWSRKCFDAARSYATLS